MATVYRTIYQGNFCSPNLNDNVIQFKRRMTDTDPIPIIVPIIFAGHDNQPVLIEYQDKGDYKLNAINGCGCTINIIAQNDFELSSLYTADEREWQVVVTGEKSFIGWLIPDSCNEPYASKPYNVSVQATDALGTLQDVPFNKADGTNYRGFLSDVDVLRFALLKTGLKLNMIIAVNTFETTMNTTLSPLLQSYINVDGLADVDLIPFSCFEVIRSVLARYSCRLHQFGGKWQIVNTLELSRGVINAKEYDTDGVYVRNLVLGNLLYAGGNSEQIQPVGNTSFAKAFAQSISYYKYGYPKNSLLNGNMDTWDKITPLPVGWDEFGINARTYARKSDQGVDTTDYFVTIDGRDNPNGYLYNTNAVSVRATESVSVSFDLYAPNAGKGDIKYLGVRITDGAGNFYTANGWQNTGGFYVISYDKNQIIGQIRVNFTVAARNEDYSLYFGVQPMAPATGSSFYITSINNVSIAPGVGNDQAKPAIGIFERIKSLSAQTYKSDPILLLHEADENNKRTSQISIGMPSPNVIQPQAWKRAAITETSTLLHIVADTELIMHGKPYRIFEADFIGIGLIDINTVLTIKYLTGNFIFLSGKFDIKTNIHNLRFAQALVDPIPSTIEIKEDYGKEKDKDGVSVGSPSGINTPQSGGSYTDLQGYAKTTDIPIKASAIETEGGTNDDKFITPFKLLGWWSNIKTAATTISGGWNFTTRPTFNLFNLLVNTDLVVFDNTTNAYTKSTLNSTYQNKIEGFRVQCPNLNLTYSKVSSGWVSYATTNVT